jgi:hypothetical protein
MNTVYLYLCIVVCILYLLQACVSIRSSIMVRNDYSYSCVPLGNITESGQRNCAPDWPVVPLKIPHRETIVIDSFNHEHDRDGTSRRNTRRNNREAEETPKELPGMYPVSSCTAEMWRRYVARVVGVRLVAGALWNEGERLNYADGV